MTTMPATPVIKTGIILTLMAAYGLVSLGCGNSSSAAASGGAAGSTDAGGASQASGGASSSSGGTAAFVPTTICTGTIGGAVTATLTSCGILSTIGTGQASLQITSVDSTTTTSAPAGATASFWLNYGFSGALSAKSYAIDDPDVQPFSGVAVNVDIGTTHLAYSTNKDLDGGLVMYAGAPANGSLTLDLTKVTPYSNVGEGQQYAVTGTADGTLVNQAGSDTVTLHLQFAQQ